ncbi:hypothetical protein [Chryseobacterium hispalense]|uniref:hypothetical protein n=1 Tax=Chryseobacterium hispalense TaxID=1453492 RepID=UPI0009E6C420|nr:hypothetical protein [Chryseobacterium hispalense]
MGLLLSAQSHRLCAAGNIPTEVSIENKNINEMLLLIEQLEEEDKNTIYRIIDGMLTKSKFKDFFNKNVATL